MAHFEGTITEFTRFIGPYARNKVQSITKKHRIKVGKCEGEGCSETKNLDAAHIRGKERPVIISGILSDYIEDNTVKVNLQEFEEKFIEAHKPIEQTIRILCKKCHREYDRNNAIHELPAESGYLDTNHYSETDETEESNNIQEGINKIIMNKSAAIHFINSKNPEIDLNSRNTVFSNVNAAIDVWWLEPANDKFKSDLYFVLNDSDNRTFYLFYLPARTITDPVKFFDQRGPEHRAKIIIPKSSHTFIDRSTGFDLGKYFKQEGTY